MEKPSQEVKETKQPHSLKSISAVLMGVGLLCLLAGGFLGVQLSNTFRARPPMHERQSDVSAIRDWMTLRYVSRVYGTPEPEFEQHFQLEPGKYHQANLAQIAKDLGQDKNQFIEEVKKIIVEFQATHTEPPLP